MISRHRRAAALLITALAAVGPRATAAEKAATKANADRCGDVSARFEQTTIAVKLGASPSQPSVSRGRVALAKPGKMRWTYEEPEPSLVVSDGKTVWIYDPALREVSTLPASRGFLTGPAAQFLLGAGDMRRDFKVTAVTCSEAAAELELIPRQPATYEKVFLGVDPHTGDVHQTRIVDLLGNVATVEFREQRFNLAPAESEFRFEVPEGVKVIELGQ